MPSPERSTTPKYGWLGAKQRSTTTESAGLTLMGDRLYNAVTGRFTSPDPEPGGNPNAYDRPRKRLAFKKPIELIGDLMLR